MTEEIEKYEPLYTLKDPRDLDGEMITEINLDLESLSASDTKKAATIFNAKKYKSNIMILTPEYNMIMAHLSSDLPLEFFDSLSARDYQKIYTKVLGFLNPSD